MKRMLVTLSIPLLLSTTVIANEQQEAGTQPSLAEQQKMKNQRSEHINQKLQEIYQNMGKYVAFEFSKPYLSPDKENSISVNWRYKLNTKLLREDLQKSDILTDDKLALVWKQEVKKEEKSFGKKFGSFAMNALLGETKSAGQDEKEQARLKSGTADEVYTLQKIIDHSYQNKIYFDSVVSVSPLEEEQTFELFMSGSGEISTMYSYRFGHFNLLSNTRIKEGDLYRTDFKVNPSDLDKITTPTVKLKVRKEEEKSKKSHAW